MAFKIQAKIFIAPGINYVVGGRTEPSYTHASFGKGTLKNKASGFVANLKLGISTSGIAMGVAFARQYFKSENETCPGDSWVAVCSAANYYEWKNYVGGFLGYRVYDSLSLALAYMVPYELKTSVGSEMLYLSLGFSIAPVVRLVINYGMSTKSRWHDSNGTAHELPYTRTPGLSLDKAEVSGATSIGLEFPIGF